MHREPRVLEAEAQVGKWLDCSARITSKELAQLHSVKNDILRSACSTSPKMDANFGEKCSYAHRQVDEQPSKKSKKNGDKIAVAILKNTRHAYFRIWSCWSLDFAEELKHGEANPMCSIHSRPKTIAWNNLPRWSSSAQPQCSKIWGSVSRRDGKERARCPGSSVENGKMYPETLGKTQNNILLTFGELVSTFAINN